MVGWLWCVVVVGGCDERWVVVVGWNTLAVISRNRLMMMGLDRRSMLRKDRVLMWRGIECFGWYRMVGGCKMG